MYNYPKYKEQNPDAVFSFMQQHPFVSLIVADMNGRVDLTQIPVLTEMREGKIVISGHIARKSSHHNALLTGNEALVLYAGPHCYVSGAWYAGNPHQASTWNYISVHARGQVSWMNEEELAALLQRLSMHFEEGNTISTTVYNNLPAEYLEQLMKAIVGFEIEVTELDNVLKLSQNRDEKSYDNIITELKKREGDSQVIAGLMEARRTKVFSS